MDDVLDRCLESTNQMINNLIDIKQAYINTQHPDFIGPELSFLNIFDDNNQSNLNNLNSNSSNDNGNNIRNYYINNYGTGLNLENRKINKNNKIDENEMIKDNKIESGYPNQMRPGIPSSRDAMETCIIKYLISSYYHVVKKILMIYCQRLLCAFQ